LEREKVKVKPGNISKMAESREVIEAVVSQESDLKDGEMKEVELEDGKILLFRSGGKFFATGNKCTHLGAPLKNGVFCDGRIRCPWHGASFSIQTGDIEDFPGMDCLHSFPVTVTNGKVIVSVSKKALSMETRRQPPMASFSKDEKRVFVIVGGGAAGATCAQSLRSEGFQGRIVMLCKETLLPYDRTKLSKAMSVTADKIELRSERFYQENHIEIRLGSEVLELDAATKTIRLNNDTRMDYDACFVAPGGSPRTIPVEGMNLRNIFMLRDPMDSSGIHNAVEGKRVIIVGSSFIGMEVASCIAKRAKSIVVIGMESVPFERVLGEKIGSALQKFHEKFGIAFRMKRVVKEFRGVDGEVRSVLLDNGEQLDADVCILGAGIIPSTKFLKNVRLERDGGVVCDQYLCAADGLYAGGDICRFPYYLNGEMVRIEHWSVAQYHGQIAAKNMLGKPTPEHSVPFFWTVQHGKSIRYCGHALQYEEIFIDGNVEELSFVGYYIHKSQVIAAVAIGRDPIVSAIAELLHRKILVSLENIKTKSIEQLLLSVSH